MSSSSAIPAHISRLLQPDETAYEMLRRTGNAGLKGKMPTTGIARLDEILSRNGTTPTSAHVLELEGESGLGKSFILMSFAARMAEAGGSVLYFDLDHRLSMNRFASFFKEDEAAMSRITIMRPTSSKQFLACLHELGNDSTGEPVRLVIIDSLLSLYQFNALTDPLAAGFSVSVPRVLLDQAGRLGFVVAASKPAVPFDIVSKTWKEGVTYRVHLVSRGKGTVKTTAAMPKFGAKLGAAPPAASTMIVTSDDSNTAANGDFDFDLSM